ncbi:MAG TPA: hypothetical protein DDY20_07310 [Desulfobulbaceae bacterium]|nr:hypothetical protein [Desulfobulbaceae bacterium]
MPNVTRQAAVIEMAAKYICNHHFGLCPMMVVKFCCPAKCSLDTLAWHCWIKYFQNLANKAAGTAQQNRSLP